MNRNYWLPDGNYFFREAIGQNSIRVQVDKNFFTATDGKSWLRTSIREAKKEEGVWKVYYVKGGIIASGVLEPIKEEPSD